MDREVSSELVDKLDGLDWFIFSGVAVKIYTGAERELNDVDLVVHENDIEEFAERLDTEVEDRDYVKKGNHIDDRGFVTYYRGLEVEATSGFPRKRMEEDTFDKLFQKTRQRDFMGKKVKVAPIEEVMVLKAKMDREKDHRDLRLMKDLEFDPDFLLELVDDWGLESEDILRVLEEEGVRMG